MGEGVALNTDLFTFPSNEAPITIEVYSEDRSLHSDNNYNVRIIGY